MEESDKPFKIPFIKKEQLNSDTYSFYFKRTEESRDFLPGQFFEIYLQIKDPDERGRDRVFTCASSPTEKEYYMITTRIIESSFKRELLKLEEGDLVRFSGPWDDLNFDENEKAPQVFLAGGIGITPFYSIVQYMIDKNLQMPTRLFVSWKKRDNMIFHEFFKNAEKILSDFTYIPTITEDTWDGEVGRIDDGMIRKYVNEIEDSRYRIAGPEGLVRAMKDLVKSLEVKKDNIIAEEFEGY